MIESQEIKLGYMRPTASMRRWSRRVIVVSVLAAIVAVACWYGRYKIMFLPQEVRLRYWEGACMSYTAPVEKPLSPGFPTPYAMYDALLTGSKPYFGLSNNDTQTLFLHRRSGLSPNSDRLVFVAADISPEEWKGEEPVVSQRLLLTADVLTPREWFSPRPPSVRSDFVFWLFTDQKLELFAGQPDPADPSRFTFRYRAGPISGTIEGKVIVRPDFDPVGSVIEYRVIDGPARPRGPDGFPVIPESSE